MRPEREPQTEEGDERSPRHGQVSRRAVLRQGVDDPPFSKVLAGVERTNVKTTEDGAIVMESQLALADLGLCGKLMAYSPTSIVFRMLGLYESVRQSEGGLVQGSTNIHRLTRAPTSISARVSSSLRSAFAYLADPQSYKPTRARLRALPGGEVPSSHTSGKGSAAGRTARTDYRMTRWARTGKTTSRTRTRRKMNHRRVNGLQMIRIRFRSVA